VPYEDPYWRGEAHRCGKDYKKAITDFCEAVELEPNNYLAHNAIAWIMATCPKENIRNGQKALEHAKKALELNTWKAFGLDTLAAALAEVGRFDEAVKCQTEALADPAFQRFYGEEGRQRLELYKNNKPFRED
jgi:tetratricopeptide (TPR) repeat protein